MSVFYLLVFIWYKGNKKKRVFKLMSLFFDINKCVAVIKYQDFCRITEYCFKNKAHV